MRSIARPQAPQSWDAGAAAQDLAVRYGDLAAPDLLRHMIEREFPGRIAVVSSFGAESAVILTLVAAVDPATPVIFLDTGKHFSATLTYRDILMDRLKLTDVRSIEPDPLQLAEHDPVGGPEDELWQRDSGFCCHLRKVLPLERALEGFPAWITGRKRFHGGERSALTTVEAVDGRVKINPLARWTPVEVAAAFRAHRLPPHPLVDEGYPSIGCAPCTRPVAIGEAVRAGRWVGLEKTECGIH
ncbi:phosphoadenylyl-sulfate reductase [Rhodospirillaceae bacterium SYSU D60014]|uniref:phosphoadenylyl-sulfate reductase n=1 Tax=Virgifigura deserti TaxID=2268457 RepID=UPI000E66982B